MRRERWAVGDHAWASLCLCSRSVSSLETDHPLRFTLVDLFAMVAPVGFDVESRQRDLERRHDYLEPFAGGAYLERFA